MRSIDPKTRGIPCDPMAANAAKLFGTRVAETILVAVMCDRSKTGHMIASDPITPSFDSCAVGAVHIWVDGEQIPVRHFGVILELPEWRAIAEKLRGRDVRFLVEPGFRFEGMAGEQATLFVTDPSGNALEFKAFADDGMVFAT